MINVNAIDFGFEDGIFTNVVLNIQTHTTTALVSKGGDSDERLEYNKSSRYFGEATVDVQATVGLRK